LSVALQILFWAIVEVLELLLDHQLLEVEDCLEAGAGREVSKVGVQLSLVDGQRVIIRQELDTEVAELRHELREEGLGTIVLSLAWHHFVDLELFEHLLDSGIVSCLLNDAGRHIVNPGNWSERDEQIHSLLEIL